LLVLLEPVVQAFRRARLERPFDEESIQLMLHEFTVFQSKLIQWRADVAFQNCEGHSNIAWYRSWFTVSSTPFLIFHSYVIEEAVAMVLSGTYIPIPVLYSGRMDIVTTFGGALLRASLDGIQHVLDSDLDLSLIPSFHLVLALLPLAALVQSGKLHPGAEEVTSRHETLVRYRRAPHDYTHYATAEADHMGGGYGEWDVGLDQLFDFESLWPMMADWPAHDLPPA
jgi:hypothetical protein